MLIRLVHTYNPGAIMHLDSKIEPSAHDCVGEIRATYHQIMFRKSFYFWLVAAGLLDSVKGQTHPFISTGYFNYPLRARAVLSGNQNITGQFNFQLIPGVRLVVVDVNLSGLQKPPGFGEYSYHVHVNPVGADGNCQATGGHLDLFNVGANGSCDFHQPHLCQTGDLSGKFGKISSAQDTASIHYIEPFLRFYPPERSIFGRSVVLHAPDSTRLACGNITAFNQNAADSSENSSP
ncbi:hypothetical protein PCANC_04014 [Puccinia coronata f. sp. avenae]|uniref:superoxide dismutase n=2 Tax=Puccinia coronata f. sp. avenae TaxID=200324 RepID=A0A2N5T7R9_9BASI|nr:hypothetical protein PCANC_04014 [Puccinia coronata f. sp. avenae]